MFQSGSLMKSWSSFQGVDMEAVRRMYLALVLFSLLKETNLWSVADRFQLSRGFVQTLLSSSSAFCSCVLHFTEVPASVCTQSFTEADLRSVVKRSVFLCVSRSWRSSGHSKLC